MPPQPCEVCKTARAQILRPKNHARICATCFIGIFEAEVGETILSSHLFHPGERVAIGASGGKDSTVLASVLKTLNDRLDWKIDLTLLSIDEGITGYRDHSLEAVKRHAKQYDLPLKIVSYADLYGWSMDQVVAQVGKKGNCTYCGVFRRQALDRGAAMLGVQHVVTGHNADDVAETVLMNLLRGDLPRLSRATSIVTSTPSTAPMTAGSGGGTDPSAAASFTNVKRSKPLMYAYEKEIVLYAHHKKLDYFSTECIYSPEAFRGSARTLIKNLERIRPECILDIVRSGIDMARLVPDARPTNGRKRNGPQDRALVTSEQDDGKGGCGSTGGRSGAGEMAEMEKQLRQNEEAEYTGNEVEISTGRTKQPMAIGDRTCDINGNDTSPSGISPQSADATRNVVPIRTKQEKRQGRKADGGRTVPGRQTLGSCERCGYLSSQTVCKACMLLEGLNKARPRTSIEVG